MGRVKNLEIVLSGNRTVFQGGEVVRGKLVIEIEKLLKIRWIRITIRGVARVHWTGTIVIFICLIELSASCLRKSDPILADILSVSLLFLPSLSSPNILLEYSWKCIRILIFSNLKISF